MKKAQVQIISVLFLLFLAFIPSKVFSQSAEDGYEVWLRYQPVQNAEAYQSVFQQILVEGESATIDVIKSELERALPQLLNNNDLFVEAISESEGGLIIGTPANSETIHSLNLDTDLNKLGEEGFLIRQVNSEGKKLHILTANSDIGLLYGTFHLLRMMQTGSSPNDLSTLSVPKIENRILNHWDNLNRLVERGYAGLSLWDWGTLPEYADTRYTDYARLNASLGINGTVLNNVNADARILTDQFLQKVVTLADVFRPYGIRVFLSVNFQAPITIGGLESADPLNSEVQNWWNEKVDEIYALIPDFGGFLVKADSEGEPGPFKYDRDHAEGANMLADAVAAHNGLVIWRAFVYSPEQSDRFREAYDEFVPLDGRFRENVLLQVKNGPIDFQPREPFSPLFGALSQTSTMLELQITQEYFGFANHLAYMGTYFEEALDDDTFANGEGSTVAKVISGDIFDYEHTGIAGVVNLGTDRNWTGHPFVQSSWYAFGRLAWDFELSAEEIADEWLKMTFTSNPDFVEPVKEIMMMSREAGVNYRMPLGLTHLYAQGHHYGPAPWTEDLPRPDWTAVYYHKADETGIGYDRTESGSNAIEQYREPLLTQFRNPETTPEDLLLWFHHVSWDYEMESGRTLWEELVYKYYSGVEMVQEMQQKWKSIESLVDERRFEHVKSLLEIQLKDAIRWRDSCVLYFQTFSGKPIPEGYEKPEYDLQYYIDQENIHYVPDPRYYPRMGHN